MHTYKANKDMNLFNYFSRLMKDTSGFSLVELGTVIIIGAMMIVPIYTLLYYVTDLKPTDQRMEIIQEALAEHLRVTGALPCPANPTLNIDPDPNDPTYDNRPAYQGIYNQTTNSCAGVPDDGGVFIGAVPIENLKIAVDCHANAAPNGVDIDFIGGLKDAMYDFSEVFTGEKATANESNRAENIRCLPNEYIMSEEGYKFVYAVSANALDNRSFDIFAPNSGNVEIVNADDEPIGRFRSYVLVDLGEDGAGAFNRNGERVEACPGTFLGENCNDDNKFLAMPKSLDSTDYIDDYVEYGISAFMQENSFWNWNQELSGNPTTELNDNAVLMLGALDEATDARLDYETIDAADPRQHALTIDDSVVINRGNFKVDGDLQVLAIRSSASGLPEGGDLRTVNSLNVTEVANARNIVTSKRFCYGSALSSQCEEDDGSVSTATYNITVVEANPEIHSQSDVEAMLEGIVYIDDTELNPNLTGFSFEMGTEDTFQQTVSAISSSVNVPEGTIYEIDEDGNLDIQVGIDGNYVDDVFTLNVVLENDVESRIRVTVKEFVTEEPTGLVWSQPLIQDGTLYCDNQDYPETGTQMQGSCSIEGQENVYCQVTNSSGSNQCSSPATRDYRCVTQVCYRPSANNPPPRGPKCDHDFTMHEDCR